MGNSVSPISFESASQTTATPSVNLGTRRTVGLVDYIYVYNAAAASIAQGQCGYLATTSMSSGYSVTVTNLVAQVGGHLVVGVAHNASIPAAEYGWLATRGPAVVVALDSGEVSLTSGDHLAAGIDGGFAKGTVTLSTGIRMGVAIGSCVTVTTITNKAAFRSPLFG